MVVAEISSVMISCMLIALGDLDLKIELHFFKSTFSATNLKKLILFLKGVITILQAYNLFFRARPILKLDLVIEVLYQAN